MSAEQKAGESIDRGIETAKAVAKIVSALGGQALKQSWEEGNDITIYTERGPIVIHGKSKEVQE